MLASFIWVGTSHLDDPGAGHDLPALFAARRPHVQPIFQIKQSPQRIRQKTPGPISDFLCVDAAFWLIQTATSASFAPVAMNSRKLPHPARRQQRTCDPPDSCSGTHRSRRRVLRGIYPPGARPRLESWRAQSAGFGELFGSDRAQAHEVFLRSQLRSNLQLLRKPRQNFATCFGDQNHVFQPYAAQSRIVQAGLNGHHLPIF